MILTKCQALFSLKNISKKIKVQSAAVVIRILKVKIKLKQSCLIVSE